MKKRNYALPTSIAVSGPLQMFRNLGVIPDEEHLALLIQSLRVEASAIDFSQVGVAAVCVCVSACLCV